MKKLITILALMCCAWLTYLYADTKQGYQLATVVKVEKYEVPSNYVGGSATDAPLQPEVYAYDIGLKVNCDVYVGRYQSATDYLPSIFARNHEVDVRVQKHILFVSLPDSDRDVKMGIVSHRRLKEQSCTAN
jgi:hypothetical protein